MTVLPTATHVAEGKSVDVTATAKNVAGTVQPHRERNIATVDFADIPSRMPVGFLLPGSALGAIARCAEGAVPLRLLSCYLARRCYQIQKPYKPYKRNQGGLLMEVLG